MSALCVAVSSLLRKLKTQSREQMDRRRPALVAALHQIPDFYMEIKWDFQTWGESQRRTALAMRPSVVPDAVLTVFCTRQGPCVVPD